MAFVSSVVVLVYSAEQTSLLGHHIPDCLRDLTRAQRCQVIVWIISKGHQEADVADMGGKAIVTHTLTHPPTHTHTHPFSTQKTNSLAIITKLP